MPFQGNDTKSRKRMEMAGTIGFALLAALSVCYFLIHKAFYIQENKEGLSALRRVPVALELLFVAGSILLLLYKNKLQSFFQAHRRCAYGVFSVVTPLGTLVLSQTLIEVAPRTFRASKVRNFRMTPELFVYNLLILGVALALFLVVTNHMRISCMALSAVGVAFGLLNFYLCKFRGNPFLASDFLSAGTAMEVAGAYSYGLTRKATLAMQAYVIFLLVLRTIPSGALFAKKGRAWFAVGAAGVAGLAYFVLFQTDYLASRGVKLKRMNVLISYYNYGPFVTLAQSFSYLDIDQPAGYSKGQMQELAERYPSDAPEEGEYPNIVVVVDEAFSDIGVLGDLRASEDAFPFLRQLMGESIHGYTYSSIMGGGTANTEFELLTGNSILLLPENAIAFQGYVRKPMDSLASYCASLGYQKLVAVHPFKRVNYRRNVVYPLLGFAEYFSVQDFAEDALRICGRISDEADFDFLIAQYEQAKKESDAPVLLYTMTMQNHGGYARKPTNLPIRIQLEGNIEENSRALARQYLNLVRCTDDAMRELVGYFEAQEEPTVILFLGDHQPDLPADYLNQLTNGKIGGWTREEQMQRYAVPFLIWANFDLPAKEYEKTSMNYLQAILVDALGMPKTGYQKYLLDMMGEIPALTANGYWGEDGNFYQVGDGDSPYQKRLTEYSQILYNNILDIKNRPGQFYGLQAE